MVEIMMALTLGLFVTAGVIQILLATRKTYLAQDQVLQLQERGRFATEFLNRYIRLAGYKSDFRSTDESVFPQYLDPKDSDYNFSQKGQAVVGIDNNPKYRKDTDSVSFRYRGSDDRTVRDCLDQVVCKNEYTITTFYIKVVKVDEKEISSLYCNSKIIETASPSESCKLLGLGPRTANPEPLVANVENMQVLYGINTDDTKDDYERSANSYIDATTLNASGSQLWKEVTSIKLSLLLSTDEDDRVTDNYQSYDYPPWKNPSDPPKKADDYRLRRVFTVTTNLRNRTP